MMSSEIVNDRHIDSAPGIVLSHLIQNQEETEYDELEIELPPIVENGTKSQSTTTGLFPSWLDGSLYTVSPGKFHFEDSGFTVEHLTDGFCIVTKVRINSKTGKITLQKKYERSDALSKAEKAGKPVLPEFFTPSSTDVTKSRFGRWISALQIENSDNGNHNIFTLNRQLFTTKGLAYFRQIDGENLSTGTKFDTLKLFGLNGICPHPLIDHDGSFYCVGGSFTATGGKQHVLKIPAPSTGKEDVTDLLKQYKIISTFSLTRAMHINIHHSFMLTDNYIVMLEQPFCLSIKKMVGYIMTGGPASFMDGLEWTPDQVQGNKFIILDKKTGKLMKTMDVWTEKPFFFLHFINAYEEESEESGETQIVVDLNCHRNTDHFNQYRLSQITKTEDLSPVEDSGVFHRFVLPLVNLDNNNNNNNNNKGGYMGSGVKYRRSSIILEPSDIIITNSKDSTKHKNINMNNNNKKANNIKSQILPLCPKMSLLSKTESLKNFGATAHISNYNNSSSNGKNNNGSTVVVSSSSSPHPHIIVSHGEISQYGIHFGTFNPNYRFKKYRFLYGTVGLCLNSPYHNSVVKFDLKTGSRICWKPKNEKEVILISGTEFIPNPNPTLNNDNDDSSKGEDDGILICSATSVSTQHRPKKDFILFINPKTMEEIARASSKTQTIPLNMHGVFVPTKSN